MGVFVIVIVMIVAVGVLGAVEMCVQVFVIVLVVGRRSVRVSRAVGVHVIVRRVGFGRTNRGQTAIPLGAEIFEPAGEAIQHDALLSTSLRKTLEPGARMRS
ncbi:MAG: hypothetical protein NVSMB59_06470 [Vulcanimicrobiaceae bacterium]